MAERDTDVLLPRGEDCPSETTLDLFHLGELEPARRSVVEDHVSSCPSCGRRLLLRQKGFAAFDEVDPKRLLERIQKAAEPVTHSPSWPWRRWLPAFGAAAAAAATLLLILLAPRYTDKGAIRTKGGFDLQVYRERNGIVEQALSGESFYPGDRLRFVVDLPEDGHLMVVGVERSGRLYMGFPADGSTDSRPFVAGRNMQLPGAIRLDESAGRERIYAVFCPRPFSLSQLRPGAGCGLEVPDGCLKRSFEMRKQKP